jgi:hypothetical protein
MRTSVTTLSYLLVTALSAGTPSDGPSPHITGFIENKGQVRDANGRSDASVLYLFNGDGLNVSLRPGGFSYEVWQRTSAGSGTTDALEPDVRTSLPPTMERSFHRVDIGFDNASRQCRVDAGDPYADHINYYTEGLPAEGATMVHHYARVTYHDLYPNIDAVFHITLNEGRPAVKYDLVVRPGGDITDIRMHYTGAPVALTAEGLLAMDTPLGIVEERVPESWHVQGKQRIQAHVNTVALGENLFGFRCDDASRIPTDATLVIDPVPTLLWETAFGQNELETFMGVAYDPVGYGYAAGYSLHLGTGLNNAVLTKYDVNGLLLWSTYYGGSGNDIANAVGVNTWGDPTIGGSTTSINGMATPGAWQTAIGGGEDGFLARFNATNGVRVWSTYYGGTAADDVSALSCDPTGSTLIIGSTQSTTGIASAGAADVSYGGGGDVVIARFLANGTRDWGTYLGGTGQDIGSGVSVNVNGTTLAVTGSTLSTSGIATAGSFQSVAPAGRNAFLGLYLMTGPKHWCTYYGGSADDDGYDVARESYTNNVYMSGKTRSTAGIATAGADQVFRSGTEDAFLTKFNATGQRLWGTYIGGPGIENAHSLTITPNDRVHVMGGTSSVTGIASPDALYTSPAPGFLMRYNSNGARSWGTYLPIGWSLGDLATRETSSQFGGTILYSTLILAAGNVAGPGTYDAHLATFREALFNPFMPVVDEPMIEASYQAEGTIRVKSMSTEPIGPGTVTVCDLQGRILHEQRWADPREPLVLDMNARSAGIYLINVVTDTRSYAVKTSQVR